jgi:electron-transferring-flavoprotein dehydrogenase
MLRLRTFSRHGRFFHTFAGRRNERIRFDSREVERPEDDVDVCIVGAGPAGLSAAIRLKQLENESGKEIRVVILEKGSEVGKSIPANRCSV